MKTYKMIVCDLDGTLAESKGRLSQQMAKVLSYVLRQYKCAVVSGGVFSQYEKQFLSEFPLDDGVLQNLYLFPTNGSSMFVWDSSKQQWNRVYNEEIEEGDRKKIIEEIKQVMDSSGIDFSHHYGDIIEDRKSQVTFSGLGQEASVAEKVLWDPDQKKRLMMMEKMKEDLKEFEVHIGGLTSIDVTRRGIDKAYAIQKIQEHLGIEPGDMLFIGDALYPGGNDEAAKRTGVDFIQPKDPQETLEVLLNFVI